MNWIFQTTGMINRYVKDICPGTQPVRVLHYMNKYMFQNTHPDFNIELLKAISENGLSKDIDLKFGKDKIATPYIRVADKAIVISETFLSYLWCICHTIYTLYIETVDYPRLNTKLGEERYKISQENIDKARGLFDYSKSLVVGYSEWDKDNLPNPEIYLAEKRNFIEQPNCFYTEAVKFILCHEYTHGIKHIDKLTKLIKIERSNFLDFEKEADFDSIELLKKGIFPSKINELAVHIGITIGILSMFYLSPTTGGKRHPNTEERLVTALEQLELNNTTPCWGIALVGLRLWEEQFNHNFTWENSGDDKKDFYLLIEQIRKKNTNTQQSA